VCARVDPRDVRKSIDSSESFVHGLERTAELFTMLEVELIRERATSKGHELGCDSVCPIAVDVEERDVCTAAGELSSGRSTDSAGCTGDDRRLA
jgi:hypothetical protein